MFSFAQCLYACVCAFLCVWGVCVCGCAYVCDYSPMFPSDHLCVLSIVRIPLFSFVSVLTIVHVALVITVCGVTIVHVALIATVCGVTIVHVYWDYYLMSPSFHLCVMRVLFTFPTLTLCLF